MSQSPYRQELARDLARAPSFGWTRPAAWVVAAVASAMSAAAAIGMLVDHTCAGSWSPHWGVALLLLTAVLAGARGGLSLQRRLVGRWLARVRVTSRAGSLFWEVLAFSPSIVLLAGSGALSLAAYVFATFKICLGGPSLDVVPLGFFGC